jgi:hypothetical protein
MNWAGFSVKDKLQGKRRVEATLFQSGFCFYRGQFAGKSGDACQNFVYCHGLIHSLRDGNKKEQGMAVKYTPN